MKISTVKQWLTRVLHTDYAKVLSQVLSKCEEVFPYIYRQVCVYTHENTSIIFTLFEIPFTFNEIAAAYNVKVLSFVLLAIITLLYCCLATSKAMIHD